MIISAVSIERRLAAMKKVYDAGIRTVCFVSPIFPEITDIIAIIERVKNQCDFIWLENLNLRGTFKPAIKKYIEEKHAGLLPLYKQIYGKGDKSYWKALEAFVENYTTEHGLPYINNYLPDGRSEKGKPTVINYFYHEEIRGSENTGKRNK